MPSIVCLKNKNGIACASDLNILLEKDHYFFVSLEPCSYTSLKDLSSFIKKEASLLVFYDQEKKNIQSNYDSILIDTKGIQYIETNEKDSLDTLRKKAISYIHSSPVHWVLFDQYGNTGSNL